MALELNYKETNENNTLSSFTQTKTDTHIYDTYWENKPNVNNNKKVTYDDILSTLNLVVSRDGVLRKMSHNSNINSDINSANRNASVINSMDDYGNSMNDNKTSNNFDNKGFQPAQFRKRSPEALTKSVTFNNNNVIEPELKNSAIFNKYFKDYKDPNTEILPRRPLTKEEYKQKIIEDIIQKRRISKIKSKKMLFTNNNNNLIKHIKPKSNKDHLFNFSK